MAKVTCVSLDGAASAVEGESLMRTAVTGGIDGIVIHLPDTRT